MPTTAAEQEEPPPSRGQRRRLRAPRFALARRRGIGPARPLSVAHGAQVSPDIGSTAASRVSCRGSPSSKPVSVGLTLSTKISNAPVCCARTAIDLPSGAQAGDRTYESRSNVGLLLAADGAHPELALGPGSPDVGERLAVRRPGRIEGAVGVARELLGGRPWRRPRGRCGSDRACSGRRSLLPGRRSDPRSGSPPMTPRRTPAARAVDVRRRPDPSARAVGTGSSRR